MFGDPLLTDLCKICHINPYKYCCPRCSARTCSLPCIKRHKQWASCNGIRDPAAYVKRSDLATPRGIDHDYNYLTSIERQLDNADRDAAAKGIILEDLTVGGKVKKLGGPAKGEVPLQAAIERYRVTIDKAPKGISRQKQNETRWDKRTQSIVWTVEWVHKNGSRGLGQCHDFTPLGIAYTEHVTPKKERIQRLNERQTQPNERPNKKRRRNPKATAPISTPTELPLPQNDIKANSVESQNPTTAPSPPLQPTKQNSENPPPPAATQNEEASPPNLLDPSAPPPLNFYLLFPSTPTAYRVLIPLSPTTTLSAALIDRLVLEFPTIYALKQPPDKLPTGFVTEDEYLRSMNRGQSDGTWKGLIENLNADEGGEGAREKDAGGEVDEGRLRDVLKMDLISVVDGN